MPNAWQRQMTFRIRGTRDTFILGTFSQPGIGTELALRALSEGQVDLAETDSAANQFGAPRAQKTRAAHFRCGPVCPSRTCRISG